MSNKLNNESIAKYQTKLAIVAAILTGSIAILVSNIDQKINIGGANKLLGEALTTGVILCSFYVLTVAIQFMDGKYPDKIKRIFNQRFEEAYYSLITSLAFFYILVLLIIPILFEGGLTIILLVIFIVSMAFVASRKDKICQYFMKKEEQ